MTLVVILLGLIALILLALVVFAVWQWWRRRQDGRPLRSFESCSPKRARSIWSSRVLLTRLILWMPSRSCKHARAGNRAGNIMNRCIVFILTGLVLFGCEILGFPEIGFVPAFGPTVNGADEK